MPEMDKIRTVVEEWLEKAEHDLTNAAFTLRMGRTCPTDTVCFHAQQCIEKYLKALLVWKEIPFPKSHDVTEILALLPSTDRPALNAEECRKLASYATATRYPGDYEPISLTEARQAVQIARRVRAAIRRMLPKATLRKRRA